jgi:cellulose synthase/poly-beta-1,6-N-acetylglucosamine synthase-like glycosyltransferase
VSKLDHTKSKVQVRRPTIPMYDQNKYQGNPILYKISLFGLILLTLIFNTYIGLSFINLVRLADFNGLSIITLLLNLIIVFIQSLTGNYAILVLWMCIRRYIPIDRAPGYLNKTWSVESDDLPTVSILIPVYAENLKVLERTLLAANDINYPDNKMNIVVVEDKLTNSVPQKDKIRSKKRNLNPLDEKIDSNIQYTKNNGSFSGNEKNFMNTPKTTKTTYKYSLEELTRKLKVNHLIRTHREGYKAGALNHGLSKINSDFVLFIDSDYILEKNIIINTLNAWREKTIGVQARIDFVNLHTPFTYIAGFLRTQYYSIVQRSRQVTGSALFAGGAALFHREALISNGGINELTIAEDTDTSYILRAKGHRIEYIDTIGAWALIPWTPLALIRQLWRWYTGVTRSFKTRAYLILRSKTPLYVRLDHFSSALFPTIAVLGWLIIIPFIFIYYRNYQWIEFKWLFPGISIPINQIIFLIVTLLPVLMTLFIFQNENKILKFTQKQFFIKHLSIIAYYLLFMACQPFLIGGIIKGWTGSKVKFNRTPKSKKYESDASEHLNNIKFQYITASIILTIIGFTLTISAITSIFTTTSFVLIYSGLTTLMLILLVIIWYTFLEKKSLEVNDITENFIDVVKSDYN